MRVFRLMLEAARIGGMVAQHNVGVMYQRGDGTERDVAKARQWFQSAADKGDEDSRGRSKPLSAVSTTRGSQPGEMMQAIKHSKVRAGPATIYPKAGLLEFGDEVRVIKRTGSWFRLQPTSPQTDRYVYRQLLTEIGSSKVAQ